MMPGPGNATTLTCPSCGQPVWPDDNFCEACRADLSPALVSGGRPEPVAACPSCQTARVSADGYCESCGRKVPSGNDHIELDLSVLAGVTDRGLHHLRNEDAMAIATARTAVGPVAVAVVCDGVSTSSQPDEASRAAANSAVQILLAAVRSGEDLAGASTRAVRAAQQALTDLADAGGLRGNAPSATLVSAIVTSKDVTVCWLGDSRCYWLDAASAAGSRQLTTDDSIAQELIARGLASEAEALASPQGHVITGWLGADAGDTEPHVTVVTPGGAGVVLLCSDGLWNYRPGAAELAELALPGATTDPLGTSAALVRFALEAGGADNVTVVLVPFPLAGPTPAVPSSQETEESSADERV